ncbi:MAG: ABC transporter ATP-binding protein [Pseudomonadales bacterium]
MSVSISLEQVSLHYASAPQPTFSNLNLTLPKHRWTCILGASGCGKTSLLRLLAGLIGPEHSLSGKILCSDGLALHGRIAYMAQQDLLLPWLNVVDNVCLESKLTTGRVSREHRQRATELLAQLGLGHVSEHAPEQLSGGMRQRVALARTLMQDTPVVLMDEPFSALDAVTRYKLQDLAASVLKGRTVLFITHDPQEALRLSDQLILLHGDSKLLPLPCPTSEIPRPIDAELGQYQQQILQQIQVNHEH